MCWGCASSCVAERTWHVVSKGKEGTEKTAEKGKRGNRAKLKRYSLFKKTLFMDFVIKNRPK